MKRTLTFLLCLAVSPVVPSQTKPVVQSRIQLDFAQQEQDQITSDRFLQKEDTLVLVGKKTIKRVDLKTGTFIQSVPINLPESVEDNERMISPDGANLLVNCTIMGMQGQPPLPLALDSLPPTAIINDIVYVDASCAGVLQKHG